MAAGDIWPVLATGTSYADLGADFYARRAAPNAKPARPKPWLTTFIMSQHEIKTPVPPASQSCDGS